MATTMKWGRVVILVLVSLLATVVSGPAAAGSETMPADENGTYSRDQVRAILADTRRIVSTNGIEDTREVVINGSRQWLSIRGRDRNNPVLLVLHGGPGAPIMPEAYSFQSPWEDFFTVVQWDQRGSGKTYGANDPEAMASSMTIESMAADAEAVARHVLDVLGKHKLFVLGHSFGTTIGLELAQRHPELLHAYIGVGQVVDMRESERLGYEYALAQARAEGNQDAERDLLALAPYPGEAGQLTIERVGAERRWLTYYGGLAWGRKSHEFLNGIIELSPDYSDADLEAWAKGSLFSVTHLLPQLETLDYRDRTRFEVPVVLFVGRHDYATSQALAAEWFAHLQAPSKQLVWFENSAHMVMLEEPGRFLMHLVNDVRPLADP